MGTSYWEDKTINKLKKRLSGKTDREILLLILGVVKDIAIMLTLIVLFFWFYVILS